VCFFFQAEDGIRDFHVTGVQTCALPLWFGGILKNLVLRIPLRAMNENNARRQRCMAGRRAATTVCLDTKYDVRIGSRSISGQACATSRSTAGTPGSSLNPY